MTAIGCVFVTVTAGLQLAASHAEKSGVVYPYKQEDWLRYLVPSLWTADHRPLMLLAGPSTVRENLLHEEFAAAFPDYRVVQGGISLGTLGDAMASLEYVERAYGVAALPEVVVLGLSPRFLAELPRSGRPFGMGVNRYSPELKVPNADPSDFGLMPKSRVEGIMSGLRFMLLKQHDRYASALEWYVAKAISPQLSERLLSSPLMDSGIGRLLFSGRARHIGIHRFALELASPYKYRSSPNPFPDPDAMLDAPNSVWREVFAWNPSADAALRARIMSLLEYARTRGMTLYVVNLPEGSANRVRYRPGYAEKYIELAKAAFHPVPVLDLRCLLPDEDFLDSEHARLRGSMKITARVIGFMRGLPMTAAQMPVKAADNSESTQKWQANDCYGLPVTKHESVIATAGRSGVGAGVAAVAARSP